MFPTFCLAIIKLHVGPSWVSRPMFPINNVFKLHCESNCRHVPHRVSDLAVNSKKVEEVLNLICFVMNNRWKLTCRCGSGYKPTKAEGAS